MKLGFISWTQEPFLIPQLWCPNFHFNLTKIAQIGPTISEVGVKLRHELRQSWGVMKPLIVDWAVTATDQGSDVRTCVRFMREVWGP
jgi:hypothetical protein